MNNNTTELRKLSKMCKYLAKSRVRNIVQHEVDKFLASHNLTADEVELSIDWIGQAICNIDLTNIDYDWITTQPKTSVSLERYDYVKYGDLEVDGIKIALRYEGGLKMPKEDLVLYTQLGKVHTEVNEPSVTTSLYCTI